MLFLAIMLYRNLSFIIYFLNVLLLPFSYILFASEVVASLHFHNYTSDFGTCIPRFNRKVCVNKNTL